MLITADKLGELFTLLRRAESNQKAIYIFASLDTDSVCATKILTTVCQQSGLRYNIVPVRGWADLEAKLREIKMTEMILEEDIENCVFINCLGTENVVRILFQDNIDETDFPNFKIFVFDFHKPVHLTNIHSSEMVWVLSTEDETEREYPDHFNEEMDDDSGSESEFSGSDSDEEGPPRKKRRLNPEVIRKRNELKEENDQYYQYTFHGVNSSWFLYQMATKINKDDNHMLWCSIVGLTKMFVNNQMDKDKYEGMVEEFQQSVMRKNNMFLPQRDAEGSLIEKRKRDHIQFSQELQLILLHHWTIYDSMYYSPIVASKLHLWKPNGKDNIDYILARMAVAQAEAHQEWASIELKVQKDFFENFQKNAVQSIGEDILFGSFTKQHGDFENLRAADMVFGLTALLEDEKEIRDAEGEEDLYSIVEQNFLRSMDALDDSETLQIGFRQAKKLQHSLADFALDLLHKNRLRSGGFFRFIEVKEKNEFYTPIAISKLGFFIQRAIDEMKDNNGHRKPPKPLVIAAWNEQANTFVVCGVPMIRNTQRNPRNPFGRAFRRACTLVAARRRDITFDTYLLEIQKDDWSKFLSQLSNEMTLIGNDQGIGF